MYVRIKTSKKAKYPTLQIVEGFRDGKKVKQRTVAHLGVIKGKQDLVRLKCLAEKLIQRLEKEGLEVNSKIEIKNIIHKKSEYNGFSLVVDQLLSTTGFSNILKKSQGKNSFDLEDIIKLIITQRWDKPGSKLRIFERQEDYGFYGVELQYLYRAMNALEPIASDIQNQALKTVSEYSDVPLKCFLFDVTTLYFESIAEDELKNFGFSKDQKHHVVQVVLALVADSQGIPVAYEVFQGNLAETKTLIPVLSALRDRFSIKNVTVVCDRGMSSKSNIQALQESDFNFVIATKLRSISKSERINDMSFFKELPGQESIPEDERIFFRIMQHPQYENTDLIVTYSPSRAEKDRKDRERLLEKLQSKLTKEDETSIKKMISNSGYKKYTNVKKGSLVAINEKAIEEDEGWDGFHGIAVSKNANLSITDALSRYKDLWHVEEAFRVAKSTLKTRPIFHWKPHRIRGHILICFMTLFLERFLELLLRKNAHFLTPDRIQKALSSVHTVYFEDKETKKEGKMESALEEDAKKIFQTLGISTNRLAGMK